MCCQSHARTGLIHMPIAHWKCAINFPTVPLHYTIIILFLLFPIVYRNYDIMLSIVCQYYAITFPYYQPKLCPYISPLYARSVPLLFASVSRNCAIVFAYCMLELGHYICVLYAVTMPLLFFTVCRRCGSTYSYCML